MSKLILDNLFGSKTRVKMLKYLFRNSPNSFSLNEIAKHIQEPLIEVKKEIRSLKEIGLVRRKSI